MGEIHAQLIFNKPVLPRFRMLSSIDSTTVSNINFTVIAIFITCNDKIS